MSKHSHNRHVTCQVSKLYMTLGRCPGSKKTKRSGTSYSPHVHHLYTSCLLGGHTSLQQEVFNASAIHKRQANDCTDYALCQDAMSTAERDELIAICTNTTNDNSNLEHDAWEMDVDTVLAGTDNIDISHAGGEFPLVMDIVDISHAGGEFSLVMDIADNLLGTGNK